MSLFAELNRRNVVRVGIAYSIASWLVAQVAEFAFDTFGAPDWALKSVVVLLLLGLPIALFFAWAFEITPEGIKREAKVDRARSITAHTGRKLDRAIVVGLVVVAALIIARPWLPGPGQSIPEMVPNAQAENSIAVLPFADLSPDGDQAYFADGISEEILNALVRIPNLKVAGRTSSFSFKDSNEDLRTISTQLGVDHVLEGSVRRSGDQLRITAQLIRGDDGFHLWSETYDRELVDIFSIQDEIARSVATRLVTSLGLTEQNLVVDRTDDILAYENYLQAHELHLARGKENLDLALLLLQEAAARDPDFAPVWTEIAGVYTNYYAYQDFDRRNDWAPRLRAVGKASAERAIELSPADGVAHAYMGVFLALENDWIEAFRHFDRAADLAPNNAVVADTIAQQAVEVGYFDKMLELSAKAVSIDPLVAIYRNTHGRALEKLDDYERALEAFEKGIELDPAMDFPHNNRVMLLGHLGRFDEMAAAARDAADAADDPERREAFQTLAEVIGDKQAARAWLETWERVPPPLWAILADDREMTMKRLMTIWDIEDRGENLLFPWQLDFLFDDPRWKAEVRQNGVLDLWRARGFPQWCRPLEGDDFECRPELRPTIQ